MFSFTPARAVLTAVFALAVRQSVSVAPQSWEHSWDTLLSAQFIDFGYNAYTDAQAAFIASHYSIVSIEKCSGSGDTESVVWRTAAQVKAFNPKMRVVFYWDTDQGALSCYSAYTEFMSTPSLWLRDDAGVVVNSSAGQPLMDYSNPQAVAWWVSVPLNGTGSPAASLIDGVLADGTGRSIAGSGCFTPSSRISAARCDALVAAKSAMVSALQALFNSTNGGIVLQNGLAFYPPPGSPADHNLYTLPDASGVMNEHFAVFEQVLPDGSLNVSLVATVIETVQVAIDAGKIVVLGTWPGPLVTPFTDVSPSWPGGTQPKTLLNWRPVMLAKHAFAMAAYLTIATPRVFVQYELWYNGFQQGALPCDDAPATCVAPMSASWYPDLMKPLGAPLGPAFRVGNIYYRSFAHANSTLNLDDPDASQVTFF